MLKAYSEEYQQFLKNNNDIEEYKKIKFIAIPILINEVFSSLSFNDIITLVRLSGSKEKNYPE